MLAATPRASAPVLEIDTGNRLLKQNTFASKYDDGKETEDYWGSEAESPTNDRHTLKLFTGDEDE
jgi:hypothetical protein